MALIYIYTNFTDSEKSYLKSKIPAGFELFFHNELSDNQKDIFMNCEFCMGNVPLDWCRATTKLQWLQLHSAGIDPYHLLENPSFQITNLRGFFAESVAETALAMVLAYYRGIDRLAILQKNKVWIGQGIRPSLKKLHRQSVWVIGGGSIANKLVELLAPFDCTIVQSRLKEVITNYKSIDYFKEKAKGVKLIFLVLPEVPETIHYFDAQKMAFLEPNTVLVNVGRGSSIEEKALKKFLKEGLIEAALLDVNEIEPVPIEDDLWDNEKVLLTQHSAGGWANEGIDKVKFFLINLNNILKNNELLNIIDTKRGY